MKEEMESLEIAAVTKELESLEGGFLQKVYQPEDDELLFRIHMPGEGKRMLLFKIGNALYLTEKDRENPMKPSDYIMLLRKYLGNASIVGIEQHDFDRVVTLKLQSKKKYELVFEVFGKGNLLLTDEEQIILPYRSESWSHRELKEGEAYRYPPSRVDPFELEIEDLMDILKESTSDLVRTLAAELNLGGKYAEEICARTGLKKDLKEFADHADIIFETIKELREKTFEEDLDPRVVSRDDETIDAVPFPLTKYQDEEDVEMTQTDKYNKALDQAFERETKEEKEEKKTESRLDRKLNQQERALEGLKKDVEENKIVAELIYQNYQKCEEVLNSILDARRRDEREKVYERLRDIDDIVQINKSDEYVVLVLEGEKDGEEYEKNVKLDFRKDVNENAQKYYQKSKKSKKKIKGAEEALEETKRQIEEGKKEKIEGVEKEPTNKYWFDKFKWFISSDDELVVAGKDAQTNEEVVKKYLEKGDRYAHAQAGGAPSVVLKKGDGDITDKSLKEACQFAIVHSKEWKRGIASGRAYWVKPMQVSKTAEAGESLPTGAFVIRGNRNYMDDLPMKAYLVETEYQGHKKVMCVPSLTFEHMMGEDGSSDGGSGPVIKKTVEFISGNKDVNNFAKEMSDHFSVPIKEIQTILPPGDVEVMEKK